MRAQDTVLLIMSVGGCVWQAANCGDCASVDSAARSSSGLREATRRTVRVHLPWGKCPWKVRVWKLDGLYTMRSGRFHRRVWFLLEFFF